MHRNVPFQAKNSKHFLGRGHSPLPRPLSRWGGGHPLPKPNPLGACGASTSPPPFTNPGSTLDDQFMSVTSCFEVITYIFCQKVTNDGCSE